ncbi:MAG TPA: anti-sigma factor [Rhodanobacteraceae bacterium]|nr:anti-sigma factor [Rhodanobacteraceae bacterium]
MNTPRDDEDREDLRYAEYVLGVLDADARAAVEREIERDPHAAAEVARWQKYLLPLAEDVAPVTPPDQAWTRLRAALGLAAPESRTAIEPRRVSVWQSVTFWRWLALGAGAVAAACIVLLLVVPRTPSAPPAAQQLAYATARIEQDNGLPGWTATLDASRARIVLVPAAPGAIPAGRMPELWLIPSSGKPIALGVFRPDRATSLGVRRDLLARINAQTLLAVSIEPPGGSPTGQPTGPVIGKGTLNGI